MTRSFLLNAALIATTLSFAAVGCDDCKTDDTGDTGDTGPDKDIDDDGYTAEEYGGDDCDDEDPSIHTGADEVCDGKDNDCDGLVDDADDSLDLSTTSTWYADADGDGYGSPEDSTQACARPEGYVADDSDCAADDASRHPGATEVVGDEIDQDCDEHELCYADGDGDGYGTPTVVESENILCSDTGESVHDTDCNDGDDQVHPGAAEHCDGVNEDCDEEIDEDAVDASYWFEDADGDGYGNSRSWVRACEQPMDTVSDRTDCDDEDASVHPGAEEIAYDGIDQDCDHADLCDLDEDGYDADGTHGEGGCGGDDCDDTNPSFHPGGLDWLNNDIDEDCDGADATEAWDLEDAPYSVVGREGQREWVGDGLAVCDLDGDGYDDLVVGAPFGNDLHGEIGVFFGSNSSSWSTGMAITDADVYITDSGYLLGAGVDCADLDGDGFLDIVAERAECYDEDLGIVGWYGGEDAWSLPPDLPDFELSFDLELCTSICYSSRYFTMNDLDGDGASEVLVAMSPQSNPDGSPGTEECGVWVIPGGTYSGSGDLEDEVWDRYECEAPSEYPKKVWVVEYADGKRPSEVAIGAPIYAGYDGRLGLLSTYSTDEGVTAAMGSLFHTSLVGADGSYFGRSATFADIDEDDRIDALIGAPYDSTGAVDGGALYFFSDVGSLGETGLQANEAADAVVIGYDEEFYFTGYNVVATGDLDGDGYGEVLTGDWLPLNSYGVAYHLLSGKVLADLAGSETPILAPSEADILTWETTSTYYMGWEMVSGDFDGDGHGDIAISSTDWPPPSTTERGKVYIYLTSDYGL